MATYNRWTPLALDSFSSVMVAELEDIDFAPSISLIKANTVDWAALAGANIAWADISANEADFKGYVPILIQDGDFVQGHDALKYWWERNCLWSYDGAQAGAATNDIDVFVIAIKDAQNEYQVWYVGKLPQTITMAQNGDIISFKFRSNDFNALVANAI